MGRKRELPKEFFDYDFKSLSQTEPHPRTRIRLLALSHIQNGKKYAEVANYLQVNLTTVKMWISRFKKEGIEGLSEKQRSGRKSKAVGLSKEIRKAIIKLQNNRAGGRVTLKDIQAMLAKDFNIYYKNLNGVYYLLKRLNFSWISSRSKHPKQDLKAQSLYKKLQKKGHKTPA
jgi:transposase